MLIYTKLNLKRPATRLAHPVKSAPRRLSATIVPYSPATDTVPGHSTWRDYYELGKPRVVALIVFTAVVGMFLAVPGLPPWQALLYGTLGIGLAASSAAAIRPTPAAAVRSP